MNSPVPSPTPLEVALARYQTALDCLDDSNKSFQEEQALEILAARDALQKQLEAEVEIPVDLRSKLIAQDKRLKKNTYRITEILDLAEYRDTLAISDDAWWWNLETWESLHPGNRFDWLFRIVKLLLLGVNFSLIGAIATRFLGGGSGLWEISGVVFSTLISLWQAQNAFTEVRQKGFTKLMKFWKIRQHWYEELQLLATVMIFVVLLGVMTNLAYFSELYKQEGKLLQSPPAESQKAPNLAEAEKRYLKAIELHLDNFDAHYKLATLYEELLDLENAKKQYLIAARGGVLEAYNNLAYWFIRDNKDGEAVSLLENGRQLLVKKDEQLEKFSAAEKLDFEVQKYSFYKNLGWARFKQNRLQDAGSNLVIAIGIAKNSAYKKYIRSPGAAYCIYAKVLQQEKQVASAKQYWRQCRGEIESRLAGSSIISAEEDKWLDEAKKQKLK